MHASTESRGHHPPEEISFGFASLVSPIARFGSNAGVRIL